MPPRKPRLSLTKAQIAAGIGAELLALCQTITADGRLMDEEIYALRDWLSANRTAELPAVEFLVSTLERILADGKITSEERKELYAAIEKVLPLESRRQAATQRKSVEAEEKAAEQRERMAQREREKAERARRRPLYSVNFMVAGVPYEGRDEIVRRFVAEGDTVFLARDPQNKYSPNAIEVRLSTGLQIGYVPEDYAPELAPYLDGGHPHKAEVVKIIGYRYSIPVVYAFVFPKDSDEAGLVFPANVPRKQFLERPRAQPVKTPSGREADLPRSSGCVVLLAFLISVAASIPLALLWK